MSDDEVYYGQLAEGADYLADAATDAAERAAHVRMAHRYRERARWAAGPESSTVH